MGTDANRCRCRVESTLHLAAGRMFDIGRRQSPSRGSPSSSTKREGEKLSAKASTLRVCGMNWRNAPGSRPVLSPNAATARGRRPRSRVGPVETKVYSPTLTVAARGRASAVPAMRVPLHRGRSPERQFGATEHRRWRRSREDWGGRATASGRSARARCTAPAVRAPPRRGASLMGHASVQRAASPDRDRGAGPPASDDGVRRRARARRRQTRLG